jgi:hypothetical protein
LDHPFSSERAAREGDERKTIRAEAESEEKMKIQWTEVGKKSMEARVYCKHCGKSNLVTASDNPFFWAAFRERPVKVQNCDHCKMLMRIKIAREGIEHLL